MIKNFIENFKQSIKKNKSKNEIICYCYNVRRDDIINSVNKGSKSIRDIRMNTKAGTGCGRCNAGVESVTYKAIKMKDIK